MIHLKQLAVSDLKSLAMFVRHFAVIGGVLSFLPSLVLPSLAWGFFGVSIYLMLLVTIVVLVFGCSIVLAFFAAIIFELVMYLLPTGAAQIFETAVWWVLGCLAWIPPVVEKLTSVAFNVVPTIWAPL